MAPYVATTLASFTVDKRATASTPQACAALVMALEAPPILQERFYVISLDARLHVLGVDTVHVGSATSVHVAPGDVFRIALTRAADSIVLAHIHPSGDPTPSEPDIETTARLVACGAVLGVRVLDHIVIGGAVAAPLAWYSIRASMEKAFKAEDKNGRA